MVKDNEGKKQIKSGKYQLFSMFNNWNKTFNLKKSHRELKISLEPEYSNTDVHILLRKIVAYSKRYDDEIDELKSEKRRYQRLNEEKKIEIEKVRGDLYLLAEQMIKSNMPSISIDSSFNKIKSRLTDTQGINLSEYLDPPQNSLQLSTSPGSITSSDISLLPFKTQIQLDFTHSYTPFGWLSMAWNEPETTSDSCRAVVYSDAISVVLADGATSGGTSSGIYSRFLAHVVAEIIPLTTNSIADLLTGEEMKRILKNAMVIKQDEVTFPNRILRRLPLDLARLSYKEIEGGASTCVQVIIHPTGRFSFVAIGDTHLYCLRKNHVLENIYVTRNIEDSMTNLIGINNQNKVDEFGEGKLNCDDVLIGVTDHIAAFIEKDREKAANIIALMSSGKNSSQSVFPAAWSEFQKQVIENITGKDDMTTFLFRMGDTIEDPQRMKVSYNQDGDYYTVNGKKYGSFLKNYYWDNGRKGMKLINKRSASNLELILRRFADNWPNYIPKYTISGSTHGYVLEMEHLGNGFKRLDNIIMALSNKADVTELLSSIRNLRTQIELFGITHGDVSPTNIFRNESTGKLVFVDLNTLYSNGCFPEVYESGLVGMYGRASSCIPSMHIHKLPFASLEGTLEILSKVPSDLQQFINKNVVENIDEEYLISPKMITTAYESNGENNVKLFEIITKAVKKFPFMKEDELKTIFSRFYQKNIYSLEPGDGYFDLDISPSKPDLFDY